MTLPPRAARVAIYGPAGGDTALVFIRLILVSNDFSALTPPAPANGGSGVSPFPVLHWNSVPDADRYELQLATSPVFDAGSIVQAYTNLNKDSLQWTVALDEGRANPPGKQLPHGAFAGA